MRPNPMTGMTGFPGLRTRAVSKEQESLRYFSRLVTRFDALASQIVADVPDHSAELATIASALMKDVRLVFEKRSELERLKVLAAGMFFDQGKDFMRRYRITKEEQAKLIAFYPDLNKCWYRFSRSMASGGVARRAKLYQEHYPKIIEVLRNQYEHGPDLAAAMKGIREKCEDLAVRHPKTSERVWEALKQALAELDAPRDVSDRILLGEDRLQDKINMPLDEMRAYLAECSVAFAKRLEALDWSDLSQEGKNIVAMEPRTDDVAQDEFTPAQAEERSDQKENPGDEEDSFREGPGR